MYGNVRPSTTVLSLVAAVAVGVVLLALSHHDPLSAFSALLDGAFGSDTRIGETLTNSTPLIFTGLAIAVGFRAGLFNIGAEGQLLAGALSVAAVARVVHVPRPVEVIVLLAAGAAGGAAWALVPGLLKARLNANEVITTLMMSYIAFYVSGYVIVHPLKAPGVLPATDLLPASDQLPLLGDVLSGFTGLSPTFLGRLHVGYPIALAAAAVFSYGLWRTVPGLAIRIVGLSPRAASYSGIRIGPTITGTMLLSGAVAGLGGAVQVLGVTYRVSSEFSPGFGFTGIAVALVGNVTGLGVVLAATLFSALQTGGQVMQREADTPVAIVDVIQGLIIFFVAVQVTFPRLLIVTRRVERVPLPAWARRSPP